MDFATASKIVFLLAEPFILKIRENLTENGKIFLKNQA